MSEWMVIVDDNERPAEGERVLIYDRNEGQNIACRYMKNRNVFMAGIGVVEDEYSFIEYFCEVTHWMPLPLDPVEDL